LKRIKLEVEKHRGRGPKLYKTPKITKPKKKGKWLFDDREAAEGPGKVSKEHSVGEGGKRHKKSQKRIRSHSLRAIMRRKSKPGTHRKEDGGKREEPRGKTKEHPWECTAIRGVQKGPRNRGEKKIETT